MALRAFQVFRGRTLVGYLGEGGGPFISSADSELGNPVLSHARYTSVDLEGEDEVSEILVGRSGFDDVLRRLEAAGFTLAPVIYEDVFVPTTPGQSQR